MLRFVRPFVRFVAACSQIARLFVNKQVVAYDASYSQTAYYAHSVERREKLREQAKDHNHDDASTGRQIFERPDCSTTTNDVDPEKTGRRRPRCSL